MKSNGLRNLFTALEDDARRESSPSLAGVLAIARRERRHRTRRRTLLVTLALLAACFAWAWRPTPSPHPAPPVAAALAPPPPAPPTEPVSIERISDRELLDSLGSTPMALIDLPDGRQRLVMAASHRVRR